MSAALHVALHVTRKAYQCGAYAWPLPDGPVPVELTAFEVK